METLKNFLDTLGFQLETFLILCVSFLILVLLLNKFLFKRLMKYLDDRNEGVKKTFEQIETKQQEIARLGEEYQHRLSQIEKTAYEKVQAAIKESLTAKTEIISEAHAQADKVLRKATEEINLEKNKALVELKQEVIKLSIATASKVIEQKMDDATHHKLVEKALGELEEKKL